MILNNDLIGGTKLLEISFYAEIIYIALWITWLTLNITTNKMVARKFEPCQCSYDLKKIFTE